MAKIEDLGECIKTPVYLRIDYDVWMKSCMTLSYPVLNRVTAEIQNRVFRRVGRPPDFMVRL